MVQIVEANGRRIQAQPSTNATEWRRITTTMKRLPRDPMKFDVFNAFAEFGRAEKVSLRDPIGATDGFVKSIRSSVSKSLSNEALLHGMRTEAMFEALVISLGGIELLKHEDSGEIYSSDETLKVPDFRLILTDKTQVLIEVKNHFQRNDAMQPFELDAAYLDGLIRYALAMNCRLFLAIYWVKWSVWTLVKPDIFKARGAKRILSMLDAMKENHMATLGDYTIATTPPLSLVMRADREKERAIGRDGTGTFTVGGVQLFCAGQPLTDPIEKRIATYLMFYGRWNYEVIPEIADGQIEAVEHRWSPDEDSQQGFEMVGSLSDMFSKYYRFATQDNGELDRLRLDVPPGSLGKLIPEPYQRHNLPLWRFHLHPAEPNEELNH